MKNILLFNIQKLFILATITNSKEIFEIKRLVTQLYPKIVVRSVVVCKVVDEDVEPFPEFAQDINTHRFCLANISIKPLNLSYYCK